MEDLIYDAESIGEMQHTCKKNIGEECPDLDFLYADTDTFQNELAELYTYSENPEFQLNLTAFNEQMENYNLPASWQKLGESDKHSFILKLLNQLEVTQRSTRMSAARCILYIVQGCWFEVQSDTELQNWTCKNVFLLYRLGVFSAFIDLLNIEVETPYSDIDLNKSNITMDDSKDIRVILNVLCTVAEIMCIEKEQENSEFKGDVGTFINDLIYVNKEDMLAVKLLNMVTKFCGGWAPHFPMKKVLLLLWKVTLLSLGGMETLKTMKMEKRVNAGLPIFDRDTIDVASRLRPTSPPANASDLLEGKKLMDQPYDMFVNYLSMAFTEYFPDTKQTSKVKQRGFELTNGKQLPWKPKVRQKDVDVFLESACIKFLGYNLQTNFENLSGLPQPIHDGVKILKDHLYTSLADVQIKKEEDIARSPLSAKEPALELTPAEILYQALLPQLPQYMIALLKILLTAAPTSKTKTESINIMGDVLPEGIATNVLEKMQQEIDINRHQEIIVKAISAILLLLLKHFKLNHIYQFEFISQHLVFANCVPLILKFFNQNIMQHVRTANSIPILDFPGCVIGDQPKLTKDHVNVDTETTYSWRNLFSCINLLRILNKLTKWKHSRIMMLVIFKSAPILKRILKIRLGLTQLYVLKLLKMQAKYLGRQWRKSNMKTVSAIYFKVRHRFNDDWMLGNELDTKPWDFQSEECSLKMPIDRFNTRRYNESAKDADFEPVDNCLSTFLGQNVELPEGFTKHYNSWLNDQFDGEPVDWETLIQTPVSY